MQTEILRYYEMATGREYIDNPGGWTRPIIRCHCGEELACTLRHNECEQCRREYDAQGTPLYGDHAAFWCAD